MRPFSQMRPLFRRICGRFQSHMRMFRICVHFSHIRSVFCTCVFRIYAWCSRFFFNPHICGDYSDLICIWGHFYFQNAYMYATVQIIRFSWKLEVIQKKDCITLLRKMPRMSKSSEPTQLNHSLAKLKIISLIIWTRGIALHIDRNDFNETRSPIGAWEVKLEI